MAGNGTPNWKNRTLVRDDNLNVLRSMNSEAVHLVTTDPPFKKGRDFYATPDSLAAGASFQDRWSWDIDVHDEWVDKLKDDFPKVWNVIESSRNSYGDDMGAFLCFMAVRILEIHRILRKDGSMYLHCDTTASHYLKELMDSIFGHDNFRNSISWQRNDGRGKGSQHDPLSWGRNTDTILFYAKSKIAKLRPYKKLSDDQIREQFPKIDKDGRRYKTGIPVFRSKSMGARPNLCFEWRGMQNPHPSGWRLSKERLEEEYKKGNIVLHERGKIERRKYADEYHGAPMDDFWGDIQRITSGSKDTGYPTQKPVPLYERIIEASSNKGDIILDPFCGCATTCIAAEKLGRRWMGIDIWEKAHEMVIDSLKTAGLLAGPDDDRPDILVTKGEITYLTEKTPLKRTDDGSEAVPYLKTIERSSRKPESVMSRQQMKDILIARHGLGCQGCYREFDHPNFFELDHCYPRSEGGTNDISNRVLLCSPCNRTKSDRLTLKGLRGVNKKSKFMTKNDTITREDRYGVVTFGSATGTGSLDDYEP